MILEGCSTAFSVHTPLVRQPGQNPAIGPREIFPAGETRGQIGRLDLLIRKITSVPKTRSYHGRMSPLQKSVAGLFGSFLIPFCVLTTVLAVIGKGESAWQFAAFGVGVVCFVAYMDRYWPEDPDA